MSENPNETHTFDKPVDLLYTLTQNLQNTNKAIISLMKQSAKKQQDLTTKFDSC
jgi:hypothetical protein